MNICVRDLDLLAIAQIGREESQSCLPLFRGAQLQSPGVLLKTVHHWNEPEHGKRGAIQKSLVQKVLGCEVGGRFSALLAKFGFSESLVHCCTFVCLVSDGLTPNIHDAGPPSRVVKGGTCGQHPIEQSADSREMVLQVDLFKPRGIWKVRPNRV